MVNRIVEEVEVGKTYLGTVRKIMDFGAFVEVMPGTDGLVHISQLAPHRCKSVSDEVSQGDQILVIGPTTSSEVEGLQKTLRRIGQPIPMVVTRGGQTFTVTYRAPELKILEDSKDSKTRFVELKIPITEGQQYGIGKIDFDGKPAEMRQEGRTLEEQFHRLTAQPV